MGIPGLTTYIANRSEKYLEPFDLHDTYLVVDGCSITCQLYNWYTKSNCAFGGDYDKYAECVRTFFKSLQKCNIIPLVILDGAVENKKFSTIMKRVRDKMQTAEFYTPLCRNGLKFFPGLLGTVFLSVMKEMGIRHVQCLFEADNVIAAAGKLLNCPVLSYDSDFYIYGVSYIPFNTMDISVTRKSKIYVKCCKIYKVASLLNTFPGLDESILPLAAILLGNDYIESNIFKDFYRYIKLPKKGRLNYNQQQCRIEATLHWLSKHKLDNAIIIMMSKVPHNNKKNIYKMINMIINEYTNISIDILNQLGFSKEDIEQITSQNVKNNFNIQTDKNYQNIMEKLAKILAITYTDRSAYEAESEAFIKNFPTWYIDEYHKALLPSYFINLSMHGYYIYSVQIEDYSQPSSVFIIEKILNVIFTLLTSGFERNDDCPKYLTRGENNKLTPYSVKYIDNIFPFSIPSLHDLRNTSLTLRKKIFDITLGITQEIDEFPMNWRLYIGTAKYWVENLRNVRSDSHIYALLFAMLHHVIDKKIGYYRSMYEFQTKYKEQLLTLESKTKTEPNSLSDCKNMNIMQALNAVERDDCILLAPFFINNGEMDQKLYTNPKKFNISTVHLFALFQNCIYQSFNLNALLEFPYKVTSISNMYNGTLLYNLRNNFNKRNNIENYINSILQSSPTLFQLFNTILIKAKLMFKICATKQASQTKSKSNSDILDRHVIRPGYNLTIMSS